MAYRRSATPPPSPGGLVTVRSYMDTVSAEIDRGHLSSEGIVAHVVEAASFNPALASAIGGARLQVSVDDLDRASALLGRIAPEESAGDDEETGAVRCPRCELAYCFHERPSLRNGTGSGAGLLFLTALPTMLFGSNRWCCHKCGHVWDDPTAGPAEVTRLEEGDPRPVFRLRRAHGGMGLFLGLGAGILAVFLTPLALSPILFVALTIVGTFIGRAVRYEVCSVAECRTLLPPGAEECPGCKGGIAGVVRTAGEHYAAAAGFRRELFALRELSAVEEKSRKKKVRPDPHGSMS